MTNAQGAADPLLTPHPLYLALGVSADERLAVYRELFLRHELDPGVVDAIRQATHGNYALGDARFAAQVTAMLGRRAERGQAGRPKRREDPGTGSLL